MKDSQNDDTKNFDFYEQLFSGSNWDYDLCQINTT